MKEIVKISGVTKHYKYKKAIDDISFSIKKGSITAILGPNGAGKSTIISMMLGLIEPTIGSVEIFDKNPMDKAKFHKEMNRRAGMQKPHGDKPMK